MATAPAVRIDLSQVPELRAEDLEVMSDDAVERLHARLSEAERLAYRKSDHELQLRLAEEVDALHHEMAMRRTYHAPRINYHALIAETNRGSVCAATVLGLYACSLPPR